MENKVTVTFAGKTRANEFSYLIYCDQRPAAGIVSKIELSKEEVIEEAIKRYPHLETRLSDAH